MMNDTSNNFEIPNLKQSNKFNTHTNNLNDFERSDIETALPFQFNDNNLDIESSNTNPTSYNKHDQSIKKMPPGSGSHIQNNSIPRKINFQRNKPRISVRNTINSNNFSFFYLFI